jgi:hypothetical protein
MAVTEKDTTMSNSPIKIAPPSLDVSKIRVGAGLGKLPPAPVRDTGKIRVGAGLGGTSRKA